MRHELIKTLVGDYVALCIPVAVLTILAAIICEQWGVSSPMKTILYAGAFLLGGAIGHFYNVQKRKKVIGKEKDDV